MLSSMQGAAVRTLGYGALALLILFPIGFAHGQIALPGADTALTVTATPTHPEPGESATLRVTSNLHDLDTATITWYSGGKIIAEGVGEKTVRITLGSLGTPLSVNVSVVGDQGEASVDVSVVPTSVDLLWEADSYTPPLYDGRALPSPGTRVRLQAIPYIPKSAGNLYSADQLYYEWRLNGALLSGSSGRGKSSTSVSAPDLFGSSRISVDVFSPDKTVSGSAKTVINSVEPRLRLYQDHPLFGLQYWMALGATSFVPDSQMTFVALPYFAAVIQPDDPLLVYGWRVSGRKIIPDDVRPSSVTLSAGQSGTLAALDLSLTHTSNIFLDAHGAWGITFAKGTESVGGGAPDLFHRE